MEGGLSLGFLFAVRQQSQSLNIFKWQKEATLVVKPEPCSLGVCVNVLNNKGSQSSHVCLGLTDCYLNPKAVCPQAASLDTICVGGQRPRSKDRSWNNFLNTEARTLGVSQTRAHRHPALLNNPPLRLFFTAKLYNLSPAKISIFCYHVLKDCLSKLSRQ